MRLIWTPRAAKDLAEAVEFVKAHKPLAAQRLGERLYEAALLLPKTPLIGRAGVVPNTRELVLSAIRYIMVYRVEADAIKVLRIRHAARRWPVLS